MPQNRLEIIVWVSIGIIRREHDIASQSKPFPRTVIRSTN